MPEIVYDGKKVSVPAGTNLVEAGAKAGIHVPVFCYQKELGAIVSCRVCAVTVKQGDRSWMAFHADVIRDFPASQTLQGSI